MKTKNIFLSTISIFALAAFSFGQSLPNIEQNDTSICVGESINLNIAGLLPDSSICISNPGTPNPGANPSPSSGGYIPLGNLGAQNNFSISMWINPSSVQNGISVIIDASHVSNLNWVVQTLNSGASWTWGDSAFTLIPNNWQHLLLTYDNGNRKIYVNGQQVQSWFQPLNYYGSQSLYLGNWPEGGRRFNGLIDELLITTDILYTSNFNPLEIVLNPSVNTFGLWHFDEGIGLTTADISNNAYPLNNWDWSSRNIIGGEQYSILWSTGDTTENITVNPLSSTTYNVTITGAVNTFSDSVNVSILGNSLSITPSISQVGIGSTSTFSATTSDPNPSYVWQSDLGQGYQNLINFGDYSGVNTPTLNIANVQLSEHNQPVRVISTSGNCIDTSNVGIISILDTCITHIVVYDTLLTTVTDTLLINFEIAGINPPNNMNTMKVYPNPASTHITIDYGDYLSMNGYTLKIINSLGQTVFTTPVNQQSSFIDLSSWTGNGIYYVQLVDPLNNTVENRKIVLQ